MQVQPFNESFVLENIKRSAWECKKHKQINKNGNNRNKLTKYFT